MNKIFTLNGCSFCDFWVSPRNWKTATKKDLDKDWYIQTYFYDPRFAQKYPKGFPFRSKVNRPKTIEERKILIPVMIKSITDKLQQGYNPILKEIMQDVKTKILHPNLPFIEAFYKALELKKGSNKHLYLIKNAIDRLEKASISLNINDTKIYDPKRSQ